MLYFYHDGVGGWSRLQNRLKVNDLKFGGGGKAGGSHMDIMASITKHVEVCIAEGTENVIPLEKSLGFKTLFRVMEEKGLLKPLSSAHPPVLRVNRREEVDFFFVKIHN